MKNLKSIIIALLFLLTSSVNAQVTVNVNIGTPPPWGPVGYTEVRYYYLPDVQAYYDIHTSRFIYLYGGTWIHRTYLPSRYRGYDLYGGYKVVMKSYRGNSPYKYYNHHKVKYAKGYKGSSQKTIGNKPGNGKPKASPVNKKTAPGKSKGSPAKGEKSNGAGKGKK